MEVALLRNLDSTRRHNRWRHCDCQPDIPYFCLAVAVTSSIVASRVAYESESCFFRAVRSTLPSPKASLFRAAKAFRAVWSKRRELTEKTLGKLGKRCTGTRQRSTYIHVHFSRNMGNFEKIVISLLGWLASRGIIEVKVTDNDKKNCTKFTWYLNFHQNLRSPHHLTSVGKSAELSWHGCRPLRCLVCYCSLISETDSRSASFIRLSIKGMVSSVLLPRLTVFLAGLYNTTLDAAFSGWQAALVLSFSFYKSL